MCSDSECGYSGIYRKDLLINNQTFALPHQNFQKQNEERLWIKEEFDWF